jgi:hypothetical protein
MASSRLSICQRLAAPRTSCCLPLPPDIVHDPDPAIYDQRLVVRSGGAPTFNNADIDTIDLWPIVPIDNVSARVRNLSTDASATQTRVDFSWSVWGIGQPRQQIATTFIDLARAGFSGSEGTVSLPLPAAVKAANRYGIFVTVSHPFDKDVTNNEGEQTIDGFQTSQGRSKTFVVPVRNPTGAVSTVQLFAAPAAIASWVTVTPSSFTLAPSAQQDVVVSVSVPSGIPPSPPGTLISASVDVLATIAGTYLGGISIAILLDA